MTIDYNKVFPEDISQGVVGGPEWLTEVVSLRSGAEERNTPWSEPKYRYDAGLGLRYDYELVEFTKFFYATQGKLKSFRFKDWSDFTTANDHRYGYTPYDELLGTGDGTTYFFRTRKAYGEYSRRVWCPRINKVSVAFDGEEQNPDNYFVDETNGTIVFLDPVPNGTVVSWGGEYDIPARFDSDYIPTSMKLFNIGEVPNIPIVGVRHTENIDEADYAEVIEILQAYSKTELIDLSNVYDYTVNTHWKGFWEYKNLVL